MPFGEFNVVTPEDQAFRRKAPMVDTSVLNPSNAGALEQGEWVVPNAADPRTFERYAAADGGPAVAFPVAHRKGSTDVQAIGAGEVYYAGDWVADTTSYDPGAGPYSIGDLLKVNEVDIGGGVLRSVLTPTTAGTDNAVAVVERPAANAANFDPMRVRRRI